MEQGELVMVRAIRGEPLVRRIVEIGEEGVLVCREATWIDRAAGDGHNVPAAGFPKAHVYRYDSDLYSKLLQAFELREADRLESLWEEASR